MKHVYDLREVSRETPVYIFGAGRGGEALFGALVADGFPMPAGFIDTTRRGEAKGVPIHRLADFVRDRDVARDRVVLIASQYWPEAARSLRAFDFTAFVDAYPLVCRLLGIPDSTWRRRRRVALLIAGVAAGVVATYLTVLAACLITRSTDVSIAPEAGTVDPPGRNGRSTAGS